MDSDPASALESSNNHQGQCALSAGFAHHDALVKRTQLSPSFIPNNKRSADTTTTWPSESRKLQPHWPLRPHQGTLDVSAQLLQTAVGSTPPTCNAVRVCLAGYCPDMQAQLRLESRKATHRKRPHRAFPAPVGLNGCAAAQHQSRICPLRLRLSSHF